MANQTKCGLKWEMAPCKAHLGLRDSVVREVQRTNWSRIAHGASQTALPEPPVQEN